MESRTDECVPEVQASPVCERIGIFKFYEEFAQTDMSDVVKERRTLFDSADMETKRNFAERVEHEVEDFRIWLVEAKNLEAETAHYCSVGLESVLLGLPIGVQIAQLFDVALGPLIQGTS